MAQKEQDETPEAKPERIAKFIARAGLCSRREAERWIADGRIAVDGKVLTTPAVLVTPESEVWVDGETVGAPQRVRLWRYHKPSGLLTTHSDPQGRPTVFEQLPDRLPRVISVGRLDINSEGLLLLTTDGGLSRRLESPDLGWVRRYRVRVHGRVAQKSLDTLAGGVTVDGIRYRGVTGVVDRQQGANAWLTLSLTEGKNREIRKLMEHLGWPVSRLIRIAYGPFQLGQLVSGDIDEVSGKVLREQLGLKIESRRRRS